MRRVWSLVLSTADSFAAAAERPDAVPIASLVDDIDGTYALLMTALTEQDLSDLPG
jgi:hypothetical protein